jgi:hypothetical protein
MTTKSFSHVLHLIDSGELSDATFSGALKKLNGLELQALFDLITSDKIGTPRERLRAKAVREEIKLLFAKFSQLSLQEQGKIWLQRWWRASRRARYGSRDCGGAHIRAAAAPAHAPDFGIWRKY